MAKLVNLCSTKLIKTITCSTCESEGYGVQNLISDKVNERSKGFLVDHFIRPPVIINISFVCEVKLNHLIIWPRVGGQKSSGIELLTSRVDSFDSEFNSVSSGIIKNEDGFLFCKYGDKKVNSKKPTNFLVRTFKSDRFLPARKLQLRIFKTWESSAVALQKIEIWGELCRNCPKESINIVTQNPLNSKKCTNKVNTNSGEVSNNKLCVSKLHIDYSQLCVPDEFIDPITNEIMIMPIIMPSGNVIDNQTLEKFVNEEAKWGRLPSDPFTGKLFSATSGPKVSIALKTRLDKFLLDNCDQKCIKNLARTLGSVGRTEGAKTSCLVSNSTEIPSQSFVSVLKDEKSSAINKKRRSEISELNEESIKKLCDDKSKKKSTAVLNMKEIKKPEASCKTYDVLKQQSLDNMLKSTLSNLPSFSTNHTQLENNVIRCEKCNLRENLYELPCAHCICKQCLSVLIKNNLLKCYLCSLPFRTADPKKVHLS